MLSAQPLQYMRRHAQQTWSSKSPFVLSSVTALTASSLLLLAAAHASYTSMEDNDMRSNTKDSLEYQIEIDFMNKLASKPYLRSSALSLKPNSKNQQQKVQASLLQDSSLRIVAVNVDLSGGFKGGSCQMALDRVYPHGVAPDKQVTLALDSNAITAPQQQQQQQQQQVRLSVEQKAWVTSLLECRTAASSSDDRPPGVQVLQADVQALNPNNQKTVATISSSKSIRSKLGRVASKELADRKRQQIQKTSDEDAAMLAVNNKESSSLSVVEQELVAPWNQYAWMEELELRLSGRVSFDATLQPARWWNRWFYGRTYQAEYPASRGSSEGWMSVFTNATAASIGSRLVDANKPHAVIANGAALQAVPKAMRLLQKLCDEQDIPLFIIEDPRAWRNTHHDIHQVLRDVRRIVKQRIISKCLQESQNGTARAFERGRLFGRIEAETKHAAKQLLLNRRRNTDERLQYEKELMDWKRLSADELMEKLQQRGVILEPRRGEFTYSQAFLSLAKVCLGIQQLNDADEQVVSDNSAAVSNDQ